MSCFTAVVFIKGLLHRGMGVEYKLLSVEYLLVPNYLFYIAYQVLQLFVHLNSRICRVIATFLLDPSLPAIVQSKQFQIYHAIAGPVRSCPQGFIQENLK